MKKTNKGIIRPNTQGIWENAILQKTPKKKINNKELFLHSKT